MSEDYDDVTYGPITFERAKHHLRCLRVDCEWRACEVDEYVNAQAKIIAVLRAEVKAWREAEDRHDLTHLLGERHNEDVLRAMDATDAAGALEDK